MNESKIIKEINEDLKNLQEKINKLANEDIEIKGSCFVRPKQITPPVEKIIARFKSKK